MAKSRNQRSTRRIKPVGPPQPGGTVTSTSTGTSNQFNQQGQGSQPSGEFDRQPTNPRSRSQSGGRSQSSPIQQEGGNPLQQFFGQLFGGLGGLFGGGAGGGGVLGGTSRNEARTSEGGTLVPGRSLGTNTDIEEGTSRFFSPKKNADIRAANLKNQGITNVGQAGGTTQGDIDTEQAEAAAEREAEAIKAGAPTIRSVNPFTGEPLILEGVQQDRVESTLRQNADGTFSQNRVQQIRNPETVDEFTFNIANLDKSTQDRIDQAASLMGGLQNLFEQTDGNIQQALQFAPPPTPGPGQDPFGLDPSIGLEGLLGVLGIGGGFGPAEDARGDTPFEAQPFDVSGPTGDQSFASASAPILAPGGGQEEYHRKQAARQRKQIGGNAESDQPPPRGLR